MRVVLDILDIGVLPVYDKNSLSPAFVVGELETVLEIREGTKVVVPCPEITPKSLRAMAELLEQAEAAGKTKAVLVVSEQCKSIGLIAV